MCLAVHPAIPSLARFMVCGNTYDFPGPRLAANGPRKGPEETPPSPRQPGPARGAGETRGSGTETTRPPAMSRMRRGPPGQPGGSNPRRKRGDAVKRPTPAEQGPWAMRAARSPGGSTAESNAAAVQKAGYSRGPHAFRERRLTRITLIRVCRPEGGIGGPVV